ncbi:MAG: OB-fold domain-containing protein [Deinococcales bacterium]
MIAFLEGVVREVREGSVVVQAGALGVEAWAPAATLGQCQVGERVVLHTHLTVRDETPVLYGFHHRDLLLLFRRLLEVEALMALGYRESQVKAAVAELVVDHPDEAAEGLIRRALARLR